MTFFEMQNFEKKKTKRRNRGSRGGRVRYNVTCDDMTYNVTQQTWYNNEILSLLTSSIFLLSFAKWQLKSFGYVFLRYRGQNWITNRKCYLGAPDGASYPQFRMRDTRYGEGRALKTSDEKPDFNFFSFSYTEFTSVLTGSLIFDEF